MLQIDARSRANSERVVFLRGGPTVQRMFEITDTEAQMPFVDRTGPLLRRFSLSGSRFGANGPGFG
jgi:hypothetical protein